MRQVRGIGRRDTLGTVIHQRIGVNFLLKDGLLEVGGKTQTKAEIVTFSFAQFLLESIPTQGLNFIDQIDA